MNKIDCDKPQVLGCTFSVEYVRSGYGIHLRRQLGFACRRSTRPVYLDPARIPMMQQKTPPTVIRTIILQKRPWQRKSTKIAN